MSRDKILAAIRRNRPEEHPLPEVPAFGAPTTDLVHAFRLVAEGSATTVVEADGRPLPEVVKALYPDARTFFTSLDDWLPSEGVLRPVQIAEPRQLDGVDLAVLPGRLGVAENGAVWLTEHELGVRAGAFIAEHLVLVLPRDAIVWNMHDAYGRIRIDETGYGVFIAGPSKTADIEQALVIGAQAARSMAVVLV